MEKLELIKENRKKFINGDTFTYGNDDFMKYKFIPAQEDDVDENHKGHISEKICGYEGNIKMIGRKQATIYKYYFRERISKKLWFENMNFNIEK